MEQQNGIFMSWMAAIRGSGDYLQDLNSGAFELECNSFETCPSSQRFNLQLLFL